MSGLNKVNNAEYENRINQVYEWLILNRWSRSDILGYIRNKTDWKVEKSQVDNYIAEANKRLQAKSREDQDTYYKKSQERIDDLYKKAMLLKDVRLCKDIALAENKILGFEKLSIEHTGKIDSNMSPEERVKLENSLRVIIGEELNKPD